MLIVSNGLVQTPDGLRLHPLLAGIDAELAVRSRQWFAAEPQTPLSLVARLQDLPAAALIASRAELPEDTRQCWVASPFHAQLLRDRLQVMPEGLLPWATDDAEGLAALLNPLLEEEGMRLVNVGAALLFCCRESLDVYPLPFAEVAGRLLPNRHPEGADGGRMMRLLAEIQMFLYRHPLHARRERGEPDVSGLWLWGSTPLPLTGAVEIPPIASRSPFLAAIADGRDARLTVTEAEKLDELVKPSVPLPPDILLLGHGHALWLRRAPLAALFAKLKPTRPNGVLTPRSVKSEAELWQRLKARL